MKCRLWPTRTSLEPNLSHVENTNSDLQGRCRARPDDVVQFSQTKKVVHLLVEKIVRCGVEWGPVASANDRINVSTLTGRVIISWMWCHLSGYPSPFWHVSVRFGRKMTTCWLKVGHFKDPLKLSTLKFSISMCNFSWHNFPWIFILRYDVCHDLNALTKSCFSLASVGRDGNPPVPLSLAIAAVGSMGSS